MSLLNFAISQACLQEKHARFFKQWLYAESFILHSMLNHTSRFLFFLFFSPISQLLFSFSLSFFVTVSFHLFLFYADCSFSYNLFFHLISQHGDTMD
jgi:hypothetical protein